MEKAQNTFSSDHAVSRKIVLPFIWTRSAFMFSWHSLKTNSKIWSEKTTCHFETKKFIENVKCNILDWIIPCDALHNYCQLTRWHPVSLSLPLSLSPSMCGCVWVCVCKYTYPNLRMRILNAWGIMLRVRECLDCYSASSFNRIWLYVI